MHWSFTSLVRFISRYLILFDAIVNGIIFLIALSKSLLLVYRNVTDFFCIYICFLQLTEFISSKRFLVESLGFSTSSIMLSASTETLTTL